MSTPTVSVVIPVYQVTQYLQETLESVAAQTYQNVQIVVVDDGSDPDPAAVIAELAQQYGALHIRQDNGGPSAAMNHGIRRAEGTYFMRIDADDTIEPGYIAAAVAAMQEDDQLGIVYSRARLFGSVNQVWGLPDFSIGVELLDNLIFASALFYKADWEAVGGIDETMLIAREDHDFILRILGLGRTVFRLDEFYFNYRQHEHSRNSRVAVPENRKGLIDIYARMFRTNIDLYAKHAEEFFEMILAKSDEINDFRHRYKHLERLRKSRLGVWRKTIMTKLRSWRRSR